MNRTLLKALGAVIALLFMFFLGKDYISTKQSLAVVQSNYSSLSERVGAIQDIQKERDIVSQSLQTALAEIERDRKALTLSIRSIENEINKSEEDIRCNSLHPSITGLLSDREARIHREETNN